MNNCDECNNPFCKELPEFARYDICKSKTSLNLKRKEHYLLEDELLIVKDGFIIPCVSTPEGEVKGLKIMSTGVLGICNLFNRGRVCFDVYCLRESQGCLISISLIEKYCTFDAKFALQIIKQFSHHLAIITANSPTMSFGRSDNRVNCIYENMADDGNTDLDLTEEEVALLTGLTRVTVSRLKTKK